MLVRVIRVGVDLCCFVMVHALVVVACAVVNVCLGVCVCVGGCVCVVLVVRLWDWLYSFVSDVVGSVGC